MPRLPPQGFIRYVFRTLFARFTFRDIFIGIVIIAFDWIRQLWADLQASPDRIAVTMDPIQIWLSSTMDPTIYQPPMIAAQEWVIAQTHAATDLALALFQGINKLLAISPATIFKQVKYIYSFVSWFANSPFATTKVLLLSTYLLYRCFSSWNRPLPPSIPRSKRDDTARYHYHIHHHIPAQLPPSLGFGTEKLSPFQQRSTRLSYVPFCDLFNDNGDADVNPVIAQLNCQYPLPHTWILDRVPSSIHWLSIHR